MKATEAQRDAYAPLIASILMACNFKSYLELGIGYGVCVQHLSRACPDVRITAVDIRPLPGYAKGIPPQRVTWKLGDTTDAFFAGCTDKYDAVFIDADHSSKQVLVDFENALAHLNPDGIVFMHDTYPPNQDYIAPNRCSDSYRAYLQLRSLPTVEFVNLPTFCGLTIVRPVLPDRRILTLPASIQE